MPELPEVETFKRYLDSTSLMKTIKKVEVRDRRILSCTITALKKTLQGKTFKNSIRHGKNLFVDLDSSYLMLHFGMTGDLEAFENKDDEPRYSKVLFEFTDGTFLSYVSMRMFGRVGVVDDMDEYLTEKKLGPDALKMNYTEFKEALNKRSAIAKSALLNQEIFAGIGNIYSDEILFRTRIHPKTKINLLEEEQLKALFKNIKDVLEYGIEHEGELSEYSQDFLIPHRDKEERCPKCGTEIERYEISGRHGFFCPLCQKIAK